MEKRNLQPDQKLARTSGLLYFLMIISTGVSYTITQNLTTGDAAAVIAKLQASHKSYQFAILGSAAGYVAFLLLGLRSIVSFGRSTKPQRLCCWS